MDGSVTIRAPAPGDAYAIAALVTELGYPCDEQAALKRLAKLAEASNVILRVADVGGKAVALATCHVFAAVHVEEVVAWLTCLVVAPENRGKGIAPLLVHRCEEWAKAQGATRLSLTSGNHRTGAHLFYTRLGYERSGVRFTKIFADAEPERPNTS